MGSGRSAALLVVLLSLLPAAACGLFGGQPPPEDTARAFVDAVARGDAAAAGALTDQPQDATTLLEQVRDALGPTEVRIELDQVRDSGTGTASVSFTPTWTFGDGRDWSYRSTFDLRRTEDSARPWEVRWSPAVIHPKLSSQQSLVLREEEASPAPVLDRDGGPLLTAQKVISVLLYRDQAGDVPAVAAALAAALVRFDPAITQQSIVDGAATAPAGNGYSVAVLREPDYQQVKDLIYELPGVRFVAHNRVLPPDREFAQQLLPTVRTAVEPQITGRPGWRVVSLDLAGTEIETLHEVPVAPGTAVTTTLSRLTQAAAENAVDSLPQQAVIVALQPSTGEVLAVAQNAAADAAGPIALSGRYPPGSTFKVVTTSAALQAGTVTAASPVSCPGTTVIDGRRIPNSDQFDLGTVELHTAFANSCNTTFARIAADLSAPAMPAAARQLGLGVDFVMAGATTVTGSVPADQSTVARAEAGFGQGTVIASPFGMALVAATVARGTMPTPVLIRGSVTSVDAAPEAPPAAVIDALRVMMREVVTAGNARALMAVPGQVYGKTGTAQFGDGTHSHGWFIGYRADLAFAVLVVDGGSSTPAVQAAARFLAVAP